MPPPSDLPPHAYVPGHTPRHDPDRFEALHRSARPGMSVAELARSAAFEAGWHFLETGFYWEAHEALEPVWMALPRGSAERQFVQAIIQTANAGLKRRMDRPRAVARLASLARAHLRACAGPATIMGRAPDDLRAVLNRIAGDDGD